MQRGSYTSWLEGHLVIQPNVPIWVCDVCGEFMYDPETVARVEVLLGVGRASVGASEKLDSKGEISVTTGLMTGGRWSV